MIGVSGVGVFLDVGLVERVGREHGVEYPMQMTVAVSDGTAVWAFRGGRIPVGETVARYDMQGQQFTAGDAGGDPGGAADQGVALGAAGQGDHDALAGLPGGGDAVLGR